jgi:hypothetical protein
MEDISFSESMSKTLSLLKQYNKIGEVAVKYARREMSSEVAMESIQRIMIERD